MYIGQVVGATCNCVPEDGVQTSTFLNCQDYRLDPSQTPNAVNATVLARGRCDFERYDNTPCPGLTAVVSGTKNSSL